MSWGVYDYPEPKDAPHNLPYCPVCGKECVTVYRDRDWQIVGCDECITAEDAEDAEECYAD